MIYKSLTLFQAFNAMRVFLNLYFDKTKADDIAILLGGLHLSNNHYDWKENPQTWDSAAWDDWMDGVHKTLQDMKVDQDPKEFIYDEWIAFLCMKNYLQLFYDQVPFQDVNQLLKFLNEIQRVDTNVEWKQWLLAINHSIHETYELDAWD